MTLTLELARQLEDATLTRSELAALRCRLARELAEQGNYEAARSAMGEFWQRIGERPNVDGLDRQTAAEVVQRAGSLTGLIGTVNQIAGAQEAAKDLLSESLGVFHELHAIESASEALIDLAICYTREGAFDEARITLHEASSLVADRESEQKLRALVINAAVERAASRFNEALKILSDAAPLVDASPSDAIKGRFHIQLALVLRNLGSREGRADYVDRALIEYAAASHYFEQAGHQGFCARVENNLGFLYMECKKFHEAHAHLDNARAIFAKLKDNGAVAQVDETRARVFLEENNPAEAERLTRASVRTLENGGEQALLVEALTTRGKALARLQRGADARKTFERALVVADQVGNNESAGLAALTFLEELGKEFSAEERRATYDRADQMFVDPTPPEILARLRNCARLGFVAGATAVEDRLPSTFTYDAATTATSTTHPAEGIETSDSTINGLAEPWAGCSLEEEVLQYEATLIKRALETSRGSVTRAARLLGITHQGLAFILQGRHKKLLTSRTPARPRRRSIMRPVQRKARTRNQ